MVREKILETTRQLIDERGLEVSVRDIAKAAEVNVSAISYHFGNKEKLIKEVIIESMMNFKSAFDKLDNDQIDQLVRLENFLIDTIELINANVEVSDYVLNQSDLFHTKSEYIDYLESVGYSKLIKLMVEITGINDQKEILIIIEQTLAANVIGHIAEIKLESDSKGARQKQDYKKRIKLFIENYFYKYTVEKG